MKRKHLLIMGLLASSLLLGCVDADPEVVCIEGERACNEAGDGTICRDNAIVVENLCVDGVQVCSKGYCVTEEVCNVDSASVCDGNSVKYCNEAGQYSYTNCSDGDRNCEVVNGVAKCVDKEVLVCTDGETQCPIGSPDKVKTCEANVWVLSDCGVGEVCKGGKCQLPPACVEKATRCGDDSQRQVCTNSTWVDKPCPAGEACEGAGVCKKIVPCENGALRCNGSIAQVCDDELWTTKEVCSGATPLCISGVCSAPPKYKDGDDCTATPNLDVCDANRSTVCVDGKIDVLDCSEYDESCVILKSGMSECGFIDDDLCENEGDTFFYGLDSICQSYSAANPLVTYGVCTLIGTQLYGIMNVDVNGFCAPLNDGSEGVITCKAKGQAGIEVKPCDAACLLKEETNAPYCACVKDSKQCTSEGVRQVCNAAGVWVDDACPTNQSCVGNGVCKVCTDGEVRCKGSVVEVCADTLWSDKETCGGETPECRAGACVAAPEYKVGDDCSATPNLDVCDANQSVYCLNNKISIMDCSQYDETCITLGSGETNCGKAGISVCEKEGDTYTYGQDSICEYYVGANPFVLFGYCHLVDGTLYGVETINSTGFCTTFTSGKVGVVSCNGTNVVTTPCEGACLTEEDTGAPYCAASTCDNGEVRCKGDVVEVCNNKAWTTQKTCSGATPVCSDGACVAAPEYKVGDDCTATPNLDVCVGNQVVYCWEGEIDIIDCGEYGENCINLSPTETNCGEANPPECKKAGDTYDYGSEVTCVANEVDDPFVIYATCYSVDGTLYGVESYAEFGYCTTLANGKAAAVTCNINVPVTTTCEAACLYNEVTDAPYCAE